MINSLYVYRSDKTDPFINLAREQVMLEQGPADGIILYLWQNEKTVVIGRNQNAFKECRVSLLEEEGGRLARRLSGGGAVFHDSGNLNFTFIMPRIDYDVDRQTEVILAACRNSGVKAQTSGRNDLQICGRKFSGSAFYKSGGRAYHHGTLLINADTNLIDRYLNPPDRKLKSKGVSSVKSRVINLCDAVPGLTIAGLCKELIKSAEEIYGFKARKFEFTPFMKSETARLEKVYADKKWRFGSNTPASFCLQETFVWGTVALQFKVDFGIITDVSVFTDAMDWELAGKIENALKNRGFSRAEMINGLAVADINGDVFNDLRLMLERQEI